MGNSGFARCSNAAIDPEVETVRVVEAVEPEGVTVAGEKLQDAPEGSPEQLNETAELNPFAGVIDTVAVAFCPPVTLWNAGVAATEKSAAGNGVEDG